MSEEEKIELEFNIENELRLLVTILVALLVALLAATLAVVLVRFYWIQIQLFIRRHLGKYDEGKKMSTADL